MRFSQLTEVLAKARIWDTVAPTLNLWGIYAITTLVLMAVVGIMVMGFIYAFTALLWYMQKPEVKKVLKDFWNELPFFRFHCVFILVELGIVLVLGKILLFASSAITTTGKEK